MRRQYHFRQSQSGLLAWDVHRLIALSENLPVEEHPLTAIAELSENHWYTLGNEEPTCRSVLEHAKLIHDADLSYPIILDASGRVMDGMHRVCKAAMLGLHSVGAKRFPNDPAPDATDTSPAQLSYGPPMTTLPADVAAYRSIGPFDEHTIPKGLLNDHATKAGTWGLLTVETGAVRYEITEPGAESVHRLEPDHPGIIIPRQRHHLVLIGSVSFTVTFLRSTDQA